jgi:V/A-type H+-transporting ATPase subunit C
MAEVKASSGSYIYVCTRMRIRKTHLLPREDYIRLLNMSLPEITRFIEESTYKKEIDELGTSFSGINLVEEALSWNMAKEFQRILEITPGTLKTFTASYLRRWDIQNVLSILRGKNQGIATGKIKEILVPAGHFDKIFLDRLLAENSVERVLEALKGTHLYPVLVREAPGAIETGSFARTANELYKDLYKDLIAEAKSSVKGGRQFLEYIRLEIDIRNIQNLCRIRQQKDQLEDVRDMMLPGGTFTLDKLQSLAVTENIDEFIDNLKIGRFRSENLSNLLVELKENRSIHEVEVELTRVMMAEMERLTKMYPFSICPVLEYLERKRYEVKNIRALTRGKEAGLSSDLIRSYLVM